MFILFTTRATSGTRDLMSEVNNKSTFPDLRNRTIKKLNTKPDNEPHRGMYSMDNSTRKPKVNSPPSNQDHTQVPTSNKINKQRTN